MDYGARAREIGAELRDIRTQADYTQGDVGDLIGWTKVMVSRTERGLKRLSDNELSTILTTIGVTGPVSERLLKFARELPLRDWWETNLPEITKHLTRLLDYERTATRITTVGLSCIPSLLQTAGYQRAVLSSTDMFKKRIEAQVDIAEQRQSVLTTSDAVDLVGIIDESVLRRPVGGKAVMAEQLRHLVHIADRPNVTLHIIPTAIGAHPAQEGPYDLLEFRKIPAAVHIRQHHDGTFIEDAAKVEDYQRLTKLLLSASKDPDDSLRLIAASADRSDRSASRKH